MGKRYEFKGPFMGFGFSEGEKLPESVAREMKAMVNLAIDSHTVSEPKNKSKSDADFNRGYRQGYEDGFEANEDYDHWGDPIHWEDDDEWDEWESDDYEEDDKFSETFNKGGLEGILSFLFDID